MANLGNPSLFKGSKANLTNFCLGGGALSLLFRTAKGSVSALSLFAMQTFLER